MKNKIYIILLFAFFYSFFTLNKSYSSSNNKINDICISKKEYRLYNLINNFRTENNLNNISLSESLSVLAKIHINDLITNHPDTSICNLHSWSDKGNWSACCYNKYLFKPSCMYNKAKELTNYKAKAYEMVFWETTEANPDSIIKSWMNTDAFADMILCEGKWKNFNWKAIGIAVKNNYAIAWFGEIKDIEDKPELCNKKNLASDTIKIIKEKQNNILTRKTGKYYIIFGSVDNIKDAEKQVEIYKKNNFPNSTIMVKDNKYRICLSSHETLKEARSAREKLGENYKDAWVLKY